MHEGEGRGDWVTRLSLSKEARM